MKRKVLAHLSEIDAERLNSINSNVATFKTLLLNQYVTKEELESMKPELDFLIKKQKEVMDDIKKKYKLPLLVGLEMQFSNEKKEIYINL